MAVLMTACGLSAENPTGDVSPVTDFEGMKALHAEVGTSPEGALKLWFDAVFLYMDPETRDVGRQCLSYLTIGLKDDPDWDRTPSNRIFVDRMKDEAYHHIFRSYAKGATPDNGYRMDVAGFALDVEQSARDAHGRGWKVVLRSGGADMPRPVYLKQSTSTDLWYVSLWANVYVDVRPPRDPSKEEFR